MATVPQNWIGSVPTTGTVELRPDARSMESLGRHHAFETAIADLVDNSLDAGAKNVLIRFVRRGTKLISLLVVDDGRGMSDSQLDVAMTVGGRRRYGRNDLGRFGLGLKAASFSQARTLVVASRSSRNRPSGRRWHLARAKNNFLCDIVDADVAAKLLDRDWVFSTSHHGTVVRWDDVTAFPSVDDVDVIDGFLTLTIEKLRSHLGLIFHRLLERGGTNLYIDVEDVTESEHGLRYEIEPIDPFNYLRSGKHGYPLHLVGEADGRQLELECHIWPGRSSVPEFNLSGGSLARQGFYVYLRDRLIQTGGWNGIKNQDKRLSLARVVLDIDGDIEGVLTLKPEKTGIEPGPQFVSLITSARSEDAVSFADYLADAEATYREARKRRSGRRAILPPGKGFDPKLRRAISDELEFLDEEPIDIRWARFEAGDRSFFEVDRGQRVVWLNDRYRSTLLGKRYGSLNDLPIVKALLYLLLEDAFRGQYLGARDKDNLDLWQSILSAAAQVEAA
jgi:hypothetical protein